MRKKFTFYSLSLLLVLLSGSMFAQAISTNTQRRERKAPKKEAVQAPATTTADGTLLYGCLYYADYSDYSANRIYSFKLSGRGLTQVKANVDAKGGGVYAQGKYYAISVNDNGASPSNMKLNIYDVKNNWSQTGSNITMSYMASDMTYDHTTNQIYGAFTNNFSTYYLGTMNQESGEVKTIAALPARMSALAANKDGDLYAIGYGDWKLYYINKATAECTEIGQIPKDFGLFSWQSGTFDLETNKLYWFASNLDDGALYEITLDGTGANATYSSSKVVADYGPNGSYTSEAISGMFTMQEVASTPAPQSAINLATNFEEDFLFGEIRFTLPAQDIYGETLSGNLDYTIQIGDLEPITGVGEAGMQIIEEVEIPQAGSYLITVVVSSNGVAGVPTTLTTWIGADAPRAVNNLSLEASGNTITLTWIAPTEGQHGGWVGNLTYTVVRQPNNQTVAEGLTQTIFSETINATEKVEYWYEVTAYCGNQAGEKAESNKVSLGDIVTVPYSEDFSSIDGSMNGYTILDENRDGSTWNATEFPGYMTYNYSWSNKANDWLITPAVALTPGNLYKFRAVLTSNMDETFRIAFGNAATAEALTQELLPPTTINGRYRQESFEYTFSVSVEEAGQYFMGIQALSEASQAYLLVDEISIDMIPSTTPAKVENFTVTPGEKGALNATISFNAPTKRINGNALSSLSKITIYRDNKAIQTYSSVTAGQAYSFKDNDVKTGSHEYKVVATNEVGDGAEAIITKYIGIDAPTEIRNMRIVEDLNESGKVIVSWDAPSEVGQHGGYVDVNALTYYELDPINGDINRGSATSFTQKFEVGYTQSYVGYVIYAVGAGGTGKDFRVSRTQVIGPATTLPYVESFPGVTAKGGWVSNAISGNTMDMMWEITSADYTAAGTQDNDGGTLLFSGKIGCASRISSSKVDISNAQNPVAVFHIYSTGKADEVQVGISKEYGEYIELKTIKLNEASIGWHRYEINLNDYKDCRFIQLGFAGYVKESESETVSLDNISIRDIIGNDLEVVSVTTPREIKSGEEGQFTALIRNLGTEKINEGDYSVELYRNGVLVSSVNGKEIAGDLGTTTISFTDTPSINDPENTVYSVKVNYSSDANLDNNVSAEYPVRIVLPVYPAVTDLTGKNSMTTVELTWSEPNIANMPATPITDNVESYADFIIENIGNWRVVDGDKTRTKIFSIDGVSELQYEHAGEPFAFQVLNPDAALITLNWWTPFSGSRLFAAIGCSGNVQNDDWLISPELNGSKQTISFFAKGGQSSISEDFEVLYSTTTADVTSFKATQAVKLSTTKNATGWEEFRIELPEGAKYFAIHYISQGKLALLVDNITYTPAGATTEEIMLYGYNIYRNGVKLNSEEIGETYYSDENVTDGETYTYKVTTVYDKGESIYSNECIILFTPTAINEVEAREVRVITEQNRIIVKGAEEMPIQIYTTTGALLYNTIAEAESDFSVEPDIYVVNVNGKVVKVLVK